MKNIFKKNNIVLIIALIVFTTIFVILFVRQIQGASALSRGITQLENMLISIINDGNTPQDALDLYKEYIASVKNSFNWAVACIFLTIVSYVCYLTVFAFNIKNTKVISRINHTESLIENN